jgi:hypothetical protein
LDFAARTFLERVSLAAREPVYSAALAWMLDEGSPLTLQQRLAVLAAISGSRAEGTRMSAETEWNDLDVLVTVEGPFGHRYVAIENKIKATEGHEQLAVYDAQLATLSGPVTKVFLTLTGEPPRSGSEWKPVPYGALVGALRSLRATNHYVGDLCDALGRLVLVSEAAQANDGGLASFAFDDPDVPELTSVHDFVDDMRLQKVVQRVWMTALARELALAPPWQMAIAETHGQALFNAEARLRAPLGFVVGLQLQGRTLKVFCAPSPYPSKATLEQHETVAVILERLRARFSLGPKTQPSPRRTRGFRSFTVVRLPEGRVRSDWLAALRPHVDTLVSAFPAEELADDAVPSIPRDE